ncbi:putative KIN28-cyclin-dependent ser/thr protein kinase [Acaromyces ingoldii]|uniref:Putative KIN28-cyclin-dependent ser/thr protein kinase n=1 Tax=Acaromyces ingoldii TaxID=215250 RepID=A0A316YLF2_9BASI|nr:putative KIN28-cyclin-dependent ser/thr protein kinase [Acaromyces ingoldii]PWN90390.1 putative KIN28-cyclin-dependent ser/thr protein kinase [Acaromyces ingoldii]
MQTAAEKNAAIRTSYAKLAKVGEGTYASVFLARHTATSRKVAIKKIKVVDSKDGMDMSAIREVKVLRELRHPNVIELVDVFSSGSTATPSLNLVLEFLDTDLERLIGDTNLVFKPGDIKSWMLMLCRGLEFCHRHYILHRDLKPNNLLISPQGELKIADFGMAREWADAGLRMTPVVITLWYRPPELLMGSRHYSTTVDMWSVGCIFAELLVRRPFITGEAELQQLSRIWQVLGSPTEKDWPGMKTLPLYMPSTEQFPKPTLRFIFPAASQDTIDMISKLLLYDPSKRMSANEALHHPYFRSQPAPTHHTLLPRHPTKDKTDNETDHPLLSHSDVKDKNRTAGDIASNRDAPAATTKKRTALGGASPNTVARLRKVARRLAYD